MADPNTRTTLTQILEAVRATVREEIRLCSLLTTAPGDLPEPEDHDAEESLVASLLHQDCLPSQLARAGLEPEHFQRELFAAAFAVAIELELGDEPRPVTPATVGCALELAGTVVSGMSVTDYLTLLMSSHAVRQRGELLDHVATVVELAHRRVLCRELRGIESQLRLGAMTAGEAVEAMRKLGRAKR